MAAGGDGGPGIIQFHVEDPATRLRFPTLELEQGTNYGNPVPEATSHLTLRQP